MSFDPRCSNDIQVFDFGGNENLSNFLMNLKNMEHFDQVTHLAIIRDAKKDYAKSCREMCHALAKFGFINPKTCSEWISSDTGPAIGFLLFPLDNHAGTLEDLCLRILAEKNHERILTTIDTVFTILESSYGRNYNRKHKNKFHTYLSTSDKYVTMPLGLASSAGAFEWTKNELEPLKQFLINGLNQLS